MYQPLPTPKKSWAIDVLTTDYLISGTVDGDRNYAAFQLMSGDVSSLALAAARIQPIGQLGTPDSLTAPWAVAYGDSIVAIIPRDQACLDYAAQRNADWKNPQPAEVYVGPYLMRGTLLSPANDARTFAAFTTGFALQQAQISSLLPGSRFAGLSASYVLVVGRHKHFVRPLS